MGKLQGKAAIVTGATSGMGRATALLFAREGAAVVASGRDPERGRAVVDEIRAGGGRAEFVPGDVSLQETNERLVGRVRARVRRGGRGRGVRGDARPRLGDRRSRRDLARRPSP